MHEPSPAKQKFYYSLGQIGNGAYNGINNAILGLFVNALTGNTFILAYVTNSKTVEGAFIQPIVGRLSDRTKSRLGRRRPYILFGIPLAVFFLAMVPFVYAHASHNLALPLIVATITLFSITWNIAGDPYQALMVDITKPEERSRYNAILSVLALLGQVGIAVYAAIATFNKDNIPTPVFYVCVAVLLVTYAAVFFGVREPRDAAAVAEKEEKIPWRMYVKEAREFTEANKLLISIFFLWTGLNPVVPLLTVYTKNVMGVKNGQAIIIYVVAILASAIFAYPWGMLASRYGMRRCIAAGTGILIAAAIGGTFAPSYASLFPIAIMAGCGFAATTVLTFPYLAQLVPASKIGAFTGLQTACASIAVPLSSGLTVVAIHFFGYRSIFALLAVMMVFDIIFLLAIDEDAARTQVETVEAAERFLIGKPVPAAV